MVYLRNRAVLGPFQFLFSPFSKSHLAFKHEAMTSSAIGKRIKHHLECATLYAGESNHGFRRGHIQADAASELSTADIGLQAQIKTSSVVESATELV